VYTTAANRTGPAIGMMAEWTMPPTYIKVPGGHFARGGTLLLCLFGNKMMWKEWLDMLYEWLKEGRDTGGRQAHLASGARRAKRPSAVSTGR
jgi:hypothetical protein